MNDSFLEELELIPKDSKKTTHQQADRHVTTRHATSSPLLNFSEQDRRDDTLRAHKERSIETISNIPDIRIVSTKDPSLKDPKKPFDRNVKKHSVSIKTLEKNEKSVESKGKLVDVRVKVDNNKQQNISGDHKIKLQETRHLKVPENKIVNRDRNWRSGSHKENSHLLNTSIKENRCSPDSSNNHSSDVSSKENSRPSDSSRETGFVNSKKEKERLPDKVKRSGFTVQEQDPVGLLTAIKELISTYTKQESTKILRAMQELHINSQATLIKNLLNQTNDLIKEVNPGKDSARISFLIEENEQLKQELITLQVRTEDLQNKLEEFESLKQENAALKLKCHELSQT